MTFVPSVKGVRVEVKATAVDSLGETGSSSIAMVAVPRDERSFSFSKGWGKASNGSSWFGSLSSSKTAKASASVVVYGAAKVILVGVKGSKQGKIQVFVDKKLVSMVDSYAKSTSLRATLWTGSLKAGKHIITFLVVGTKGRPTVSLDALFIQP